MCIAPTEMEEYIRGSLSERISIVCISKEDFTLIGWWMPIYGGGSEDDMTWHDMTWHDMTWHGVTWRDMTWRDMMWHDMTWCDVTWHDMASLPILKVSSVNEDTILMMIALAPLLLLVTKYNVIDDQSLIMGCLHGRCLKGTTKCFLLGKEGGHR
jgi:hypothetical protein